MMANGPKGAGVAPKEIYVAGGGPAGLTAAIEILRLSPSTHVTLCEATEHIGGISRTACHHGNRIDIGGHRFFSKSAEVLDFWARYMPTDDSGADDETLAQERGDRAAMLQRRRVSRIYYLRRFFDYPVSLSMRTLRNMGLWRTLSAGAGYIAANCHKRPETSLENFYVNRFGRPLYRMFFEGYTEKVWGVHPSRLGADWGSQRVKGLSLRAVLKDTVARALGRKQKQVETSLIESFIYPRLGPGQLWERVAADIAAQPNGRVLMQSAITGINTVGSRVVSVELNGDEAHPHACDALISSMPLKDLVAAIKGENAAPADVRKIASALPYRDFITVGLLLKDLKIKNTTRLATYRDRVPDTWIYIQERDVRIGRLQVFNNWSPAMVADWRDTIWIGLEYFCNEGDELWQMSDEAFIKMAISELAHIGVIDPAQVLDAVRIRVQKAYPAYYGAYYQLDKVRQWLDSISNLYCVGRNGQHRYNNMDHSMLTGMLAAKAAIDDSADHSAIWAVNTDEAYHETKN